MTEPTIQTYTLENKNALRKLAILRSEDQLCDLMFMFPEDVQIQAHKAIVSQYSSVIAARCLGNDQHKLQVLATEIDSEQPINPSIMNIMLDYIYGLSITIRQEYIQDIMRLAIKLNIPEFLADCDRILFESKSLSPPDIMINTQNIKQEQTGSGYETGQVSDFEMANQSIDTPSTSFHGTNLTEGIDEMAAKPTSRRKRKAAKAVKANLEKIKQLSEAELDEDDMMDEPLDDDTDDYEAENITAVKEEGAGEDNVDNSEGAGDAGYDLRPTPRKRKRSKPTKRLSLPKKSYQKKTPTLDPLLCKECDQRFDAYKDAAEHHKSVHNLIVCDICAKIFDNEADLRRHSVLHSEKILIVDDKGRLVYHCHHCSEEIQHRQSFLKHLKTHGEEKVFTCKMCDSSWKNLWYFTGHVYSHTTDSPKCMCNICGKIIKGSLHRLEEHIASLHSEGKSRQHQCSKCSKSFNRESLLTRHLLNHAEKTHECLICAAKFSLKDNLKSHVALVHNGEKSHTCKACGLGFGYKRTLQSHYLRNPHCANKALVKLPDLKCKVCSKSFLSKHALDHHIANLHSESPALFKCTLSPCNKTFKVECDLKKHIRRAHIKPHLCSICGKSFGDKTDLVHHSNIHTGERPYQCETCDKAFANYGSLYKHRQLHASRPPPSDSLQYTFPISP